MKKPYHFLAMWCNEGLECIFDVAAAKQEIENWEKSTIFSILKEEKHGTKPRPIPLQMMIFRAAANMQRCYEIYEFTSTLNMPSVRQMFKDEPQATVSWIRENGHEIYSDYVKDNTRVVIR
jgi:hypothetical protein